MSDGARIAKAYIDTFFPGESPVGRSIRISGSDPIQIYQQYVAAYGLVFREKSEEQLDLPAHEGSLNLSHALPYSGFGVRSDSGVR